MYKAPIIFIGYSYFLYEEPFNAIQYIRQMIEAAAMLIDECDNFRLEDYAMMFSMGEKRTVGKNYGQD